MSESTDTTAVLPVVEQNPAPAGDSETTVTMPVVTPLAAAPLAAPPQPVFDPDRARALHAHRVLQRILATPGLPLPKVWEGHAYSSPMLDLTLLDGGAEALTAYQRVFGGQLAVEQVSAHDSAAGFPVPAQEYAHLATVIEGIDVVVTCWTPIPDTEAAPQQVAEAPVETPVPPETVEAVAS
ncbi:hypothetical protein ABH931_006082 [Streptacidiphilus sp. MAP12-33]|uniref:hypothetical protein n=1 Tax=Streptacidiphilus sp. MAP12-33 TaxID=3156266 RepID=UPI00351824F5